MEEKILIQNLRLYPYVTLQQGETLMEELRKSDSKEMLVFPNPEQDRNMLCVLLAKYHTPALTNTVTTRDLVTKEPFCLFTVPRTAMRTYISYLGKQMNPTAPRSTFREIPPEKDPLERIQEDFFTQEEEVDVYTKFLQQHSPVTIQQELDRYIIGQEELTRAVGDFLYYHALRQKHPELPQRPLMIAGPSGSGKTEVWRIAKKLYGKTFQIQVVDGSSMSCEGWSGNYKLNTFVTPMMAGGGILVVDEFDKLATPRFSSSGDNVSHQMQAEFLKLFEGEYIVTENKRQTSYTSKTMGFVLVGAFEELRQRKERSKERRAIGFGSVEETIVTSRALTDEDYIAFGIMPEVVGRIAVKVSTNPLDEDAYLNIICNRHSRVSVIENVLRRYGIRFADVISQEELRELIRASQTNRTGVRWVSAQVETRLLEAIRERGLFPPCTSEAA